MKKLMWSSLVVVCLLCFGRTAHAATAINSDWTLTRDEVIEDDVKFTGGTIDLNGYVLTITGNLIQSGGTMNINGGSLVVSGDYRIQSEGSGSYSVSYGYLRMTNAADYVFVGGHFVTQSYYSHGNHLTAGVMEVKGDFKQITSGGNRNNFMASGTHKVILSGEGLQTVSFENPDYSCFNDLEIKKPVPGQLRFASRLPVAGRFITNGYNELTDVSFTYPWTLEEDMVINATTVFLVSADIDLNGKKLTVKSHMAQSGGVVDLKGSVLTITGSLLQSGGTMNINGGSLVVSGDYRIQSEGSGSYSVSYGYLRMTNAADYVFVGGHFVTQSYYSHGNHLTAGVMEVKGDFKQITSGGNRNNFMASGTHKVILSGEGLQTVSFENPDYSCFNDLEIKKPVPGQLKLASNLPVAGSFITHGYELTDVTFVRAWTLNEDTVINITTGFFRMSANIDLNGKKLRINGSLLQSGGTMNINGGSLVVSGDYRIQSESSGSYSVSYGYLRMTSAADYVFVGGHFVTQSYYSHGNHLTAGVMEVKGDFRQISGGSASTQNFMAGGTHKVILSGDGPQTVGFTDPASSCFNDLELRNYTANGINFTGSLNVARNLITNGIPLPPLTVQAKNWALAGDEVIEGDLRVTGATLNLGGKTLVVKGNLIHAGGTINVNGGRLIVKGDYLMQAEDGGTSSGYLNMLSTADYVKVGGDFVTKAYNSQNSHLTAGTLEVQGDFSQLAGGSSEAFKATGTHRVLLSGAEVQTVNLANPTTSRFNILVITKPLETGYAFTCPTPVWNTLVEQPPFSLAGLEDGGRYNQPVTVRVEYTGATLQRILIAKDGGAPVEIPEGYIIEADGRYVLLAEGSNAAGIAISAQVSFALDLTPPTAVITGGPFEVFNDGTMLIFDGSGSTDQNGISEYKWSFSDDGSVYTGRLVKRAFPTPGQFTVTLTVKDGFGNTTSTQAQILVRNKGGTVIEIVGVEEGGRYNHDVTIEISVMDGTLSRVLLDGVEMGTLVSLVVTSETPNPHSLVVEATNDLGYTTTKTVFFAIDKTKPVAVCANNTGYVGEEIVFDASASHDANGIAEYKWSIIDETGETETYSGKIVKRAFTAPGSFSGTLTVRDTFGNWSEPKDFTVSVAYRPVEIVFAGVENGGCYNHDVTVTVRVDYGTLISLKDQDGNEIANGTTFTGDRAYRLIAVGRNPGGEERTAACEFTVDKTPPTAAIAAGGRILGYNDGEPVVLDGGPSADNLGIARYDWVIDDDPSRHYYGMTIQHVFASPGIYTATLTVTDTCGNVSTPASVEIEIRDKGSTEIIIEGAADGGRYRSDLAVSVVVRDGSLVAVTLDGAQVAPSFTVSSEEPSPHLLTVEAANENEYRTTKTIRFWLDKTPPVARPGADITVYKDDPVQFNATGSTDRNGISTYRWRLPGGEELTEAVFTHVFTEVGTYQVGLEVMDSCGNWSAPATRTVTVVHRPPKVTVGGVAKNGRYNHDVTIDVAVEHGSIGSLTLNGKPFPNSATVSASGKYVLEVEPLDEGGQAGAKVVYEFIIDKNIPLAVIREEGLTVYEGTIVLLDGTLSSDDSGYLTYAWTIEGDPLVYRGAAVKKVFDAAGIYQVTLVVTDPAGNASDPARATVTVKPRGNVEIVIAGADDGAKYNRNVQAEISVNGGSLAKLLVDNQLGPVNPYFNTEGIHEIHVEAVSETGYTAVKRLRFSIDKTPPEADAGGERTVIQDRAFTLTGRGTDRNPITAYKWVLSDGRELEGNNLPVVFAAAGVHTATLTVMDDHGNWSEPSTAQITVRCRAPEVKITGITDGQKTNQDVAVDLEIKYGSLKEMRLNGQPYTAGTPITAEGYYYLDIFVLDLEGAEHSFKTHFAIDRTPPVADAGPDAAGWNDGAPLAFNAYRSSDDLGIEGFAWTFSDAPEVVHRTPVVRRSFDTPGTYTVTLVVTDMAGNVSAPDTATITIRDAGHTVITFTGFSEGERATRDILAGVAVTGGTLTRFTLDGQDVEGDSILVTVDGKHEVTAEATSEEGYVRRVSSYFYIDKSLPVPDVGGDKIGYNGQEFIFDGGFSYDPVGIAEYRWTFSDIESTCNEERVTRTFETPGEYLAQLWVRDTFGNWCAEPATARIIIKDRGLLATLEVTVDDGGGRRLPGTILVLEDEAGNRTRYIADDAGQAVFAAEAGSYKLYAYHGGYKSTVVPVTLAMAEAGRISLSLTPGMDIQIVSEAERLDLEEIKALGIDINDPANRWICRFEARIVYEGIEVTIPVYANGRGQPFSPSTGSGEYRPFPEVPGGGEGDLSDKEPEWPQAVIITRGTASVLKEFYDLTVYVLNLADPSITLDDLKLNLNLPEGLALAPISAACESASGETIRLQRQEVEVPSVPGQATQKVIWTLRGDQPGSYCPSVDYRGILNPFAYEIAGRTQPAEPVVITDPRVLHLHIETPAWAVMGEKMDVKVSLVNNGEVTFYDAYLKIDEIELDMLQPAYDLSKLYARKDALNPGEAISLTFQVIPLLSGPCVQRTIYQIGGNVSFTLQALPPAPMDVHAEAGDGVVHLYWFSTYEYDMLCHRVKRREEGQTEYKVVGDYVYDWFFDDTTVENFKKYYYVVVAVADLGEGEEGTPSQEVVAYPGVLTADPAPGAYEDPITVGFNLPAGCDIYYTTDGSRPTREGAKLYSGPIRVNRTMTINAIVVNGGAVSKPFSFHYKIQNPFFGDFADYDWTWQAPAGASYINRGNSLTIDLPADGVYDPAAGGEAVFLREVTVPSWTAETRLTLARYTPGSDFAAGIMVLAGEKRYTWGFYRGTDLAVEDGSGSPLFQVDSGAAVIHLRVRREGPLYCFEYKQNEADPWIHAGSVADSTPAGRIGLFAGTWTVPAEMRLVAEGFAVTPLPNLDPNWRFAVAASGPHYHALGPNSFIVSIPQRATYTDGLAPRMLRHDMGAGDWSIKAQAILKSYTGTDFRAGLAVESGMDERYFFGLEGPNLVARRLGRAPMAWSVAGIGPNVYLRMRKTGARYSFEYRTLTTGWTLLAESESYLPVEGVGVVAETWVTPTQLAVEIQNFSLTQDETAGGWGWRWEAPSGPDHWFVARDAFVIDVPDDRPYDEAAAAAPKMVRSDLGLEDWMAAARVEFDSYQPEAGFLSGLLLACDDGTKYYWGLQGGTDLVLLVGETVLARVPGVGKGAFLGLEKLDGQIHFLYRLGPDGSWETCHTLTPASPASKIGLLTRTWERTAVRAVFAEVSFARRLDGVWKWHIPKAGPTYQVNTDGSVTLTVPDDQAYNHTTSLDEAPQCYRMDMGEKDWILEGRVSLDEYGGATWETGLMVSLSQYDLVFFGLTGDGRLRVGRSAGYGTSITAPAETVYLQIQKKGAVYIFAYRLSPQHQWSVIGTMEIGGAPRWVGFMTRTGASCRVKTTFSELSLTKIPPEYRLTLRIKNDAADSRVSGATLWVDDLAPIDVDAMAPFDVRENVLTLTLREGIHSLRLSAAGYEDCQASVELTRDMELKVGMKPLPASGEDLVLYGEEIVFDEVDQRITVRCVIVNNSTDARLWVRVALQDTAGQTLAFVGQKLYLASGGLAVLGGEGELAFVGLAGVATVRIEVYPADAATGTPLLAMENRLEQD